MRPEVQSALGQLRSEIDILAASVLARNRLAAPEMLTAQRISIGSARAAVRTTDLPARSDPPASLNSSAGLRAPKAAVAMAGPSSTLHVDADMIITRRDALAAASRGPVVPGNGSSLRSETGFLERLFAFLQRVRRAIGL